MLGRIDAGKERRISRTSSVGFFGSGLRRLVEEGFVSWAAALVILVLAVLLTLWSGNIPVATW